MKSITSPDWLRRSGRFFAVAALTLTTLGVWVAPALTTSLRESIATRMSELQASDKRWIQIDLKK
jgi:hypothetical protein